MDKQVILSEKTLEVIDAYKELQASTAHGVLYDCIVAQSYDDCVRITFENMIMKMRNPEAC